MAVADIGKKDFVWSCVAQFFKVGSGVLLYPLILRSLPSETVGVWTIFTTIALITSLLDFGFQSSFARNVAYVFSGVRNLHKQGFESLESAVDDSRVDYSLLRDIITAMKYFYSRIAVVMFVLLFSVGSVYIYAICRDYQGDVVEVYIAWVISCMVNCYDFYTLYYTALLEGRGMVKRANQIAFVGNVLYLFMAAVLVLCGYGLIAIVVSQAVSVVLMRVLNYRVFFVREVRERIDRAPVGDYKAVFNAITPNAVKIGLTSLGGFIINRSSTFIGSLYIPLSDMASFGITLQLVMVVRSMSNIVTRVYIPKVFQWRVENNIRAIRRMFYSSSIVLLAVFVAAGVVIVVCGNWALGLIESQTFLISGGLVTLMLVQYYLETNHSNAAQYLLSKNEVPFFKASLLSAGATLILLLVFVAWLRMGVLGMILAPMLSQLAYQNWKWPLEVVKELR